MLAATPVQGAQENNNRHLVAEYVSNSLPRQSLANTNQICPTQLSAPVNDETNVPRVSIRHDLTSGDRWEKFETEFGVADKDPSLVKGSLESAKYQIDRTLFGLQECLLNVQKACSFDCELRNLGNPGSTATRAGSSSVPIPLWDTMERARFQTDVDLKPIGGRSFVGLRLVLPIGD